MEDLVVSFPPNVDRCVTRESVVVSDCLPQCASPGRFHWKPIILFADDCYELYLSKENKHYVVGLPSLLKQ